MEPTQKQTPPKVDPEKKQLWLDRVGGDVRLSELVVPSPTKHFSDKQSPYLIRTALGQKQLFSRVPEGKAGIALIDVLQEEVFSAGKDRQVVTSHFEAVRRMLPDQSRLVQAFDVGISPKMASKEKIAKSLEFILKTHKESGVKVVGLAIADQLSFSVLEDLRKRADDPKISGAAPITAQNLNESSALVKQIFEYYSKYADAQPDPKQRVKPDLADAMRLELKIAAVVEGLIKEGVAVVQGGGNSGPKQFAMLGALVPEMIVTYGTKADQRPHPESCFHSGSDIGADYEVKVPIQNGSVSISGTSFTVPIAADRVAQELERGESISKINILLRAERDAELSTSGSASSQDRMQP